MADEGGGVLRELLAVFGIGVDTSDLKKGKSEIEAFAGQLKKLATGVAGLFAVKEVFEFGNAQAELLDKIDDTSTALGISTDRVQELRLASREMGDDAEALLNNMGRLQVAQQAASKGSANQAAAFSTVKTKLRDANGEFKSADQLLFDVADGIKGLKSPSQQAAAAVALFGRGGRQLLPFLKEGSEGFKEVIEDFKQLGGGYTKKAIEAGGAYQKQTARMAVATESFKNVIVTSLLPVLTWIVKGVTWVIVGFRELAKNSYIVQAALVVLGAVATAFAVQMAIAFAPVLLIAAAIGALILLVDDLITLFTGGDSEIGDLIDKIFGKGASTETVKTLKDLWFDIGGAIKEAYQQIKLFIEQLEKIGGGLGDALGKGRNAVVEAATYDEADTKAAARRRQRIEAAKGGGLYIAPGENAEQAKAATIAAQALAPQVSGRPPASPGVTVNQTGDIKVDVHAAPGMDEKKLGEHAARQVHEVIKQRNRTAAATFQRANPNK